MALSENMVPKKLMVTHHFPHFQTHLHFLRHGSTVSTHPFILNSLFLDGSKDMAKHPLLLLNSTKPRGLREKTGYVR